MATIYWLGTATAVAQVSTVQITAVSGTPSDTTYTITIGGDAVSVVGDTDVNTTAANLQAALAASTSAYFKSTMIVWTTSAADTIMGTAQTAGLPFTATSSVAGGTGTIGAVAESTAGDGPSNWATPANWSGGAIPVSTDDIIIRDSSVNIAYGLTQTAVLLDSLTIEKTYTGKIGLDRTAFHTSADAETTDTTRIEPGATYLKIGAEFLDIGQHFGTGTPNGSQRIKIDNSDTAANTTTIHGTASTSTETGLPAARLLFSGAGASTMYVREATAGVGVAIDVPGETTTISEISVSASGSTTVQVGAGTTLTTFNQTGGDNVIEAAATVTTINADGGSLQLEGDWTLTALNIKGATVTDNHTKAGGAAVTTCTITDGTLDLTESSEPRTYTTLNPDGGQISIDTSVVTVTTLDKPASGVKTISVS